MSRNMQQLTLPHDFSMNVEIKCLNKTVTDITFMENEIKVE